MKHSVMAPLLRVQNLSVWYPVRSGTFSRVKNWVKAVRGVDLEIGTGEIVAVVGESGCGKSTLASAMVGLRDWQSGTLALSGVELNPVHRKTWREVRKQVQMVFQDPNSSLNPRQTLSEILIGPQRAGGISAKDSRFRAIASLEQVGLRESDLDRFPHAFSGGQRQRIGIARALALQSKILLCDEPTSALDVSVQAQILQLLQELRERLGLSILIISHDLSVVRALADRVMVMYLGSVVEEISARDLLHLPKHPYTQALLGSVPSLDPDLPPKILSGEIPSLLSLPVGCAFQDRCPYARPACSVQEPFLLPVSGESAKVRCPFHEEIG
jgi:oligopeptide/dipeptide ABC transporter ATP-binding protein